MSSQTSESGRDTIGLTFKALTETSPDLFNIHMGFVRAHQGSVIVIAADTAQDASEYARLLCKQLEAAPNRFKFNHLDIATPPEGKIAETVVAAFHAILPSARRYFGRNDLQVLAGIAKGQWTHHTETILRKIVGKRLSGKGRQIFLLTDFHKYPEHMQCELLRLLRTALSAERQSSEPELEDPPTIVLSATRAGLAPATARLIDHRIDGPLVGASDLVRKAHDLAKTKGFEKLLGDRLADWIALAVSHCYPSVSGLDELLGRARSVLASRIGAAEDTEQGFVLARRLMVFLLQEQVFPEFHASLIERPDGTDAWLKIQIYILERDKQTVRVIKPALLKQSPWKEFFRDSRLVLFLQSIFRLPRPLAEVIGSRRVITSLLWEAEQSSYRRPSVPEGALKNNVPISHDKELEQASLAISYNDFDSALDRARDALETPVEDPTALDNRRRSAELLYDVREAALRRKDFAIVYRAMLLQARLLAIAAPAEAENILLHAETLNKEKLTNDPVADAELDAAKAHLHEARIPQGESKNAALIAGAADRWRRPRQRFIDLRMLDRAFDCLRHETLLRLQLSDAPTEVGEFDKQFRKLADAQIRPGASKMEKTPRPFRVFLSYRHTTSSRAIVDAVKRGLDPELLNVWYDMDPPTDTDRWRLEILRQIWDADLVVFFIGSDFLESYECMYELHLSLALHALTNKRITWLMLDSFETIRKKLDGQPLLDLGAALQLQVGLASVPDILDALRRRIQNIPGSPYGGQVQHRPRTAHMASSGTADSAANASDAAHDANAPSTESIAEEDMNQDRQKHLEMIQSTVGRLAGNSFLVKGWSVSLTAAILALGLKENSLHLIFIAWLPCLMFWALDAYYLSLERRYRVLFDRVRGESGEATFDLSICSIRGRRESWAASAIGSSVLPLHAVTFIAIGVLGWFVGTH